MKFVVLSVLLVGLSGCSIKQKTNSLEMASHSRMAGLAMADSTEMVNIDRQIRKTANLTIEVPNLNLAVSKTAGIIQSNKGLIESQTVARGESANVLVRVPPDRLDQVMDQLVSLGKELDRTLTAEDLTKEIADLDIQVRTQKVLYERLTQLLKRAKDVKEILELERELARIQTDIEQLEGHLKRTKNDVAMATLHVYLKESVKLGPLGWVGYQLGRGLKWLFVWN